MSVPRIKRLDPNVANKIAAQEIIQRPSNALKELMENCLDAGATQIQVTVKEGGLKLLQIQDNGHGIRKEDLDIVCERHTTSKLEKYDDLYRIATYGFRGEALASISLIAHLTITTKTAESPCAYRATYVDGKLSAAPGQKAEPKPCAGNNGTLITVEDLFYNSTARRKAFRSPSDEYNRVLDVISRYAIHNAGVSFSCKKSGAMTCDVQTPTGSSTIDVIRLIYGPSVATELLLCEASVDNLDFSFTAHISNANYSMKKTTLLLFINNRAVDSNNIKRMIESVYSPLLPKGGHPFVYLSLNINPKNIDVNVHPTKQEVRFLNEDRLIDAIQEQLQLKLENANESRTFYTQTLLPGAAPIDSDESMFQQKVLKGTVYNQVRTDSKMTTLHTYMGPTQDMEDTLRQAALEDEADDARRGSEQMDVDDNGDDDAIVAQSRTHRNENRKERVQVTLTSILDLRKKIKKSTHAAMTSLLANHTFVGCVDDTMALIQHDTSLYLVNFAAISEELFYQIILSEFNNFGTIQLSTPLPIRSCIRLALDAEAAQGPLPPAMQDTDRVIDKIVEKLADFSEMLFDYFSISMTADNHLTTLPMLIRGYMPTLDKLPLFFLRLGTEVDWEDEQQCLDGIARELAILYCAEPPLPPPTSDQGADDRQDGPSDAENDAYKQQHAQYLHQVQHLVFPALKTGFVAPKSIVQDGSSLITKLASTADLYKIFERC
ncbi:histidine kinase-like ATPase [Gongronella butleri]|nr:histidine kinase-like ATPase [Gongronella butleri]